MNINILASAFFIGMNNKEKCRKKGLENIKLARNVTKIKKNKGETHPFNHLNQITQISLIRP